jgi:antitoxin PrlF
MEISKISAKGQTTIPSRIRKRAGLREGDTVTYEVRGDGLFLRKVEEQEDHYLKEISDSMDEWNSPEDMEAWNDL